MLFTPNILNIQNNSANKGKNIDTTPANIPASLNAIIVVHMCVTNAVMAKTTKIEFNITFITLFLSDMT